jgi:hypothetical protein
MHRVHNDPEIGRRIRNSLRFSMLDGASFSVMLGTAESLLFAPLVLIYYLRVARGWALLGVICLIQIASGLAIFVSGLAGGGER